MVPSEGKTKSLKEVLQKMINAQKEKRKTKDVNENPFEETN